MDNDGESIEFTPARFRSNVPRPTPAAKGPPPQPRGRPGPGTNRLLVLLPEASRERLRALGHQVQLTTQQVMARQGDRQTHVFFPERGMISLVVLMEDGRGVEAASVGFEGMVGAAVALGDETSPYETVVQVAGAALRVSVDDFRQLAREDAAVLDVALRNVQVQLLQASRAAACNRLHEVEERLARWLLQTHDWVWTDRFLLTQEFLAQMLGVRRATVTVAAGALQRAGLIGYRRGDITILDRQGLEEVACEDYAAVRQAIDRLLPLNGAAGLAE